jgi:spermidine synthase
MAPVIPPRSPGRITDADVVPYVQYAGNLGACRRLFAEAPLNTDDRPLIEYMAPKTQQRAVGDEVPWLMSYELLRLFVELFEEVPPEEDPYLALLSDEQIAYVRAGLQLYTVAIHVQEGRLGEAAPLYRDFLDTIPFDIFPGLASHGTTQSP